MIKFSLVRSLCLHFTCSLSPLFILDSIQSARRPAIMYPPCSEEAGKLHVFDRHLSKPFCIAYTALDSDVYYQFPLVNSLIFIDVFVNEIQLDKKITKIKIKTKETKKGKTECK